MILRSSLFLASVALLQTSANAFVVSPPCASTTATTPRASSYSTSWWLWSERQGTAEATVETTSSDDESNNPMGLTPELLKLANAFEAIGDDKLRYKQLLYMANKLPAMDASQQIPENKVPGCLSTVYIDVKPAVPPVNGDGALKINFQGDSDGLLTKGLVALLIRGLSGNTAADIQKVDPAFIQKAGIAASLTPGRNNGFLNMLAVMKRKAQTLQDEYGSSTSSTTTAATAKADEEESTTDKDTNDRSRYDAMVQALQILKPTDIRLEDVSYQHTRHKEAGDNNVESHFELYIVSDAFEGLNLIKRHQLVYMTVGQVMSEIHALQITAQTPSELVN